MRSRSSTALCLADLDLTPGQETITVRTSKTWASQRTIPLLPALHPLLQEWLAHQADRELAASGLPLLATRHGTPLKTTFAWRLVKRVAYRAGIRPIPCTCHSQRQTRHQTGCPRTRNGHNLSHVTPHTLRRTYATHLLNHGLRLEVVSKLLGHATTTITERAYAQLLDDTTRRELLHALQQAA